MRSFSLITEADLTRARGDPAFRQKLLAQNLDMLLSGMKKLRGRPRPDPGSAKQLREGVELAVRLAELLQAEGVPSHGP